jgi:RNA polymerase sigma-70 factor (ECF subfamily)
MSNPISNHRETLVAAASGDDAALARLVRAYHGRVYQFGLRVCRDSSDADDAVQEAFIKLANRPDVAGDRGVLSWLFTVVRHACVRLLRPFARERRTLGERIEDPETVPSRELDAQAALEQWEMVHAVHQAIAALARPYREVLVMRDIEGLTGEETCVALGLNEATMKTRLHRARQDLRAALRGVGEGSTPIERGRN